ncbi:MAG: hypothetical protein NTV56_00985 [Alphaproteobacteria bacterium]|nr:hypothetical protein [Alphaproteobacteria bacterium]
MRVLAVVFMVAGWAGIALAAPLTLVCTGTLTLGNDTTPFDRESAIVDLERRTIKPPLYPEFSITIVKENDITFGNELTSLSTWGGLDRVSGKLTLNVLRPADRKSLMTGGSVHFLALMEAKCVPAQRMF